MLEVLLSLLLTVVVTVVVPPTSTEAKVCPRKLLVESFSPPRDSLGHLCANCAAVVQQCGPPAVFKRRLLHPFSDFRQKASAPRGERVAS